MPKQQPAGVRATITLEGPPNRSLMSLLGAQPAPYGHADWKAFAFAVRDACKRLGLPHPPAKISEVGAWMEAIASKATAPKVLDEAWVSAFNEACASNKEAQP